MSIKLTFTTLHASHELIYVYISHIFMLYINTCVYCMCVCVYGYYASAIENHFLQKELMSDVTCHLKSCNVLLGEKIFPACMTQMLL